MRKNEKEFSLHHRRSRFQHRRSTKRPCSAALLSPSSPLECSARSSIRSATRKEQRRRLEEPPAGPSLRPGGRRLWRLYPPYSVVRLRLVRVNLHRQFLLPTQRSKIVCLQAQARRNPQATAQAQLQVLLQVLLQLLLQVLQKKRKVPTIS